ncbi:MAG TPA: NAD-dependent epimerase/dehydratase family protein [Clostridiales bacterium]|nr:NAD-dependent epimerase/dehydratase family protein [Clostridiales bacterium]
MDKIIEQDCLEYLEKIDLSPLKGKTVLITGANGLIGTYLITLLHLANVHRNLGVELIAVSRSSPCEKLRDIFEDRYHFLSVNLAEEDLPALPCKTDYIIHGATYAQPGKFLERHGETIHLNTVVTESLLKLALRDHATLLFLSSSEIYGNPDPAHIPTAEDFPGLCPTDNVRAVYAESKRMGETLCYCYREFEGVDAKAARISMTYGPGVSIHDKRVMGQFMKQALTNRKIEMLDDGRKERTFCYIADCMLMLLNILLYGKEFVYNVGGRDRISIRELAQEICSLTGSTLTVKPSQERTAQSIEVSPDRVQLDIGKVCTEFHLETLKPFREGLARTIAWNRQLLN